MLDLRDSVQKGRDLDVPDDGGATAVSTASYRTVCVRFCSLLSLLLFEIRQPNLGQRLFII